MFTPSDIAGMMDISAVQAQSTLQDIDSVCSTAEEFGAAAVFSLPAHAAYMRERLSPGSSVALAGVSGFPGGAELSSVGETVAPDPDATVFHAAQYRRFQSLTHHLAAWGDE